MRARQCVISFREPGLQRDVQAGKFVEVRPHVFVYVNDVTLAWDLFQKLDAWGVAPCVLAAMDEMGIKTIHYCCTDEGVTYGTTVETVRALGILKKYGRRGHHYHLARQHWDVFPGLYHYARVHRVWKLEWLKPEKVQADQMEMAL